METRLYPDGAEIVFDFRNWNDMGYTMLDNCHVTQYSESTGPNTLVDAPKFSRVFTDGSDGILRCDFTVQNEKMGGYDNATMTMELHSFPIDAAQLTSSVVQGSPSCTVEIVESGMAAIKEQLKSGRIEMSHLAKYAPIADDRYGHKPGPAHVTTAKLKIVKGRGDSANGVYSIALWPAEGVVPLAYG